MILEIRMFIIENGKVFYWNGDGFGQRERARVFQGRPSRMEVWYAELWDFHYEEDIRGAEYEVDGVRLTREELHFVPPGKTIKLILDNVI